MGEARKAALRLDFDRRLKLEFHGTRITSDGGLLAYRELDQVLGLTSAIDSELRDIRTGKNTQHGLAALLRQSIYRRLAGYDDTNDAERLAVDPAMRHIAGGRATKGSAASTSVMSRFETEILAQPENLAFLMNLPGKWVDRVNQRKLLKHIILDMDSSVSPTYGNQEGTAYNGSVLVLYSVNVIGVSQEKCENVQKCRSRNQMGNVKLNWKKGFATSDKQAFLT